MKISSHTIWKLLRITKSPITFYYNTQHHFKYHHKITKHLIIIPSINVTAVPLPISKSLTNHVDIWDRNKQNPLCRSIWQECISSQRKQTKSPNRNNIKDTIKPENLRFVLSVATSKVNWYFIGTRYRVYTCGWRQDAANLFQQIIRLSG